MMLPSISVLGSLLLGAITVLAQTPAPPPPSSQLRVRLNPTNVRDFGDPDYTIWTIDPSKATASGTFKGVSLTLAAGGSSTLSGNFFKLAFARFVSFYGERVVNQGITTQEKGQSLTLTITGLTPGNHTLLTYHNSWDYENVGVVPLSIAVDGQTVAENVTQSIRIDNIWDAAYSYLQLNVEPADQTVTVVYTPGSGNNALAYLNALFIDSPPADNLVSFPSPLHNDEHVELDGATSLTATWSPPKLAGHVKYNVYFGTGSRENLTSVGLGQCSTKAVFSNLDIYDIYYWRVDVVSNGTVFVGNTFKFRIAHLAFPGAEGWGRWARGGRRGKIVHVTTLEDNNEPGSLRHALVEMLREPRIIVFDVGGVITLKSRLPVNGSYITLAGQTAPGKGIAVQGWPIGLTGASDVIFQHIRVRPGKVHNLTTDGMGMAGSNHCIFDRISTGWAMDECFSSRNAYNITLQRSFISEPLNVAGHKNYPPGKAHGFAASISGDVGSFHHNLIAHAEGRSWSMAGDVDAEAFFKGRLDLRNNVVYNFGNRVTDGGVHQGVFVGNVYKHGPRGSTLEYMLEGTYENQLFGEQTYHCDGNTMWSPNNTVLIAEDSVQYPPGPNNTWPGHPIACYARIKIFDPPPMYKKFYEEPFFPSHITEHRASLAYKIVLSDRGVQSPVFDAHDARIVTETLTGTALYNGSYTGHRGVIDHPDDAGGLEDFPTVVRDASWDADGDGIADWWDGSTGGEGYTPIEGYLGWMSEAHVFVEPGAEVRVNLTELARGFTAPVVFAVTGATKGVVTVEGEVATYKAGGQAGVERLTIGVKDADGDEWARPLGVAVFAGASKAQ